MRFEHILYEARGRIAVITINRPERLNAIDADTSVELREDVQRFYRDCKVMEIGEGTSHIQRNTIARQLGL